MYARWPRKPQMSIVEQSQQQWAVWFDEGPVVGGFSTRHPGNVCFSGTDREAVSAARRGVLAELGVAGFALVEAQQVQGSNVFTVTPDSLHQIWQSDGRWVAPASDALITVQPRITLSLYYADCVPIFLWLPEGKGIGLVHAGWRGSLKDVAGKTVAELGQLTDSSPAQLRAIIGPAICRSCYEVGPEVIEAAAKTRQSEAFLQREEDRWHLDLKSLNKRLLIEAGLRPEHLEVSPLCTMCRPDLFFSYRAEGTGCGEMGAFIAIL